MVKCFGKVHAFFSETVGLVFCILHMFCTIATFNLTAVNFLLCSSGWAPKSCCSNVESDN